MGTSGSRWIPAAVWALAAVTLVLGCGALVNGPAGGPGPIAALGACSGQSFSPQYTGTLSIDGGSLASSATAGVGVRLSFFEEVVVVDEPSGVVASAGCEPFNESLTTDAAGAFAYSDAPFAKVCVPDSGGTVCTGYSGLWGPLTAALTAPAPVGYAPSFRTTAVRGDLALVWELTNVSLDPGGPTVALAPNAATPVDASSWEANGSATSLDPTYAWNLTGAGWVFDGPTSGDRAIVEAAPGAAAGTLSVRASATINGTSLSAPPASIALDAVSTEVTSAALNRTIVDVGATVYATVTATGAPGYPYRAWFAPGLGLAPVAAPCTTAPVGTGAVQASCVANLTYSEPGIAQPTVNVSNGFSTGVWSFPNVTVNPPAALWVDPLAPVGYSGAVVRIDLIATNGSGTLPFQNACLDPGSGPVVCQDTPGPRWTFAPVYPTVGSYPAQAWTIDAGGTNRTIGFSVAIVPPLGLDPVTLVGSNATVGSNVSLRSTVVGGDLPGRFWWNSSLSDVPLGAGAWNIDGPLTLAFAPSSAGSVTIALTVVDSLGTVVRASLVLAVAPLPASRIEEVDTLPTGPVEVGIPTNLTWQALDRSDEPVTSFAVPAEIVLGGTGVAAPSAWVNASGVGPLSGPGNGTYDVPTTAWASGALEVSVDFRTAGTFSVNLTGARLPGPVASVRLDAAGDASHLRLYGPRVARSGSRDNSTFWNVADRFGNPVPGGNVTLRLVWGNSTLNELVYVVLAENGTTGVWINYSAPGGEGGTVTVLDWAKAVLLGPIAVPAIAGPAPATIPYALLAGLVVVGAVGAVTGTAAFRRTRPRGPARSDEGDLQRLAEGRSALVELVRRIGPADLPELEAAWQPPPAPDDLADWLASLVADGTLGATLGSDGRARFCLAPGPAAPRVTLDTAAFDEALRRRDRAIEDDEPGP